MYPKTEKIKEGSLDKIKMQFLTEKLELILDRDKCTGCCVCVRACPKQAFTKAEPEGPATFFGKQVILKRKKYYVPFIHDPNVCVFCGLCTYLCPFDALRVQKNGELIEPDNIKIAELKAIPKLDAEMVELESGKKAKVYMKGTIEIVASECNVGCKNCADICPSGAIVAKPDIISKNKSEWEQDLKMEIYPSKCIYCGACDAVCPTGALKLSVNEVKYSGDYNSPFWDDVLDRITFKPE
jgi:4Fe-4S ferredoxin